MKCNLFPLLFAVGRGGGGGDFGSGSGSKFNCAARVGSDDLGYGPGSGFSFEPVQTSNVSHLLGALSPGGQACASAWCDWISFPKVSPRGGCSSKFP